MLDRPDAPPMELAEGLPTERSWSARVLPKPLAAGRMGEVGTLAASWEPELSARAGSALEELDSPIVVVTSY